MEWKKLLNPDRRRKSDKEDADVRVEFQRDYDRSIFSTPIRRLQDKAQVFPLEPNDSVRTRLTHSHEVSCVARGIALGAILKEPLSKLEEKERLAIPTIAATAGLLHDLGNPPFGHAGEEAIQDWFKLNDSFLDPLGDRNEQMAQDFLRFEGNAQTIRLVTRLQVLKDFYGLNLTYGTLSACCKYVAPSNASTEERKKGHSKKPGFYLSEAATIKQIREATGTHAARNPITYMVEAADDLVYATVDLEDAVAKDVLTWPQVCESLTEAAKNNSVLVAILKGIEEGANPNKLALPRKHLDVTQAQIFRTKLITHCVDKVVDAFFANYDKIMAGTFDGDLVSASEASTLIKACKDVAYERVYFTAENTKLEVLGRKVISDLLSLFWEGAKDYNPGAELKGFAKKIFNLTSTNYRLVCDEAFKDAKGNEPKRHYARLQLVTDYVCGMTDTFACSLHKSLFNGS